MSNNAFLRESLVKRLRTMLNERGIPHIVHRSTMKGHKPASVVAYITDEVGGVIAHRMTPKSLLCEQEWMELPVICPQPEV